MKTRVILINVAVAVFMILGIGFVAVVGGKAVEQEYKKPPQFNTSIPTPTELQEMLVAEGYDIKVDGKIGKNTIAAWEDYACNKYAVLEFRRVEK